MDAIVDGLIDELKQRVIDSDDRDKRILIGLCGIPGSGKSQLAQHVVTKFNEVVASTNASVEHNPALADVHAVVVGMDGWHLTRAQLDAMPDPEQARARRGAQWTFDDEAFASFVETLHASSSKRDTVSAPSFSHAKKDPVPDDIHVVPGDRVVVIEGLYANLNEGAWARAAALYDARWVIECDEETATQRLVDRHVQTGVAGSKEEAIWRVNNNDLPNGRYLSTHLMEPAKRIRSADEDSWRE